MFKQSVQLPILFTQFIRTVDTYLHMILNTANLILFVSSNIHINIHLHVMHMQAQSILIFSYRVFWKEWNKFSSSAKTHSRKLNVLKHFESLIDPNKSYCPYFAILHFFFSFIIFYKSSKSEKFQCLILKRVGHQNYK